MTEEEALVELDSELAEMVSGSIKMETSFNEYLSLMSRRAFSMMILAAFIQSDAGKEDMAARIVSMNNTIEAQCPVFLELAKSFKPSEKPVESLWAHLENGVCHECVKFNLHIQGQFEGVPGGQGVRGLCHKCAFAVENQGPPPVKATMKGEDDAI
jgi:hypothetical protein